MDNEYFENMYWNSMETMKLIFFCWWWYDINSWKFYQKIKSDISSTLFAYEFQLMIKLKMSDCVSSMVFIIVADFFINIVKSVFLTNRKQYRVCWCYILFE
jgi:hypothetical protein